MVFKERRELYIPTKGVNYFCKPKGLKGIRRFKFLKSISPDSTIPNLKVLILPY